MPLKAIKILSLIPCMSHVTCQLHGFVLTKIVKHNVSSFFSFSSSCDDIINDALVCMMCQNYTCKVSARAKRQAKHVWFIGLVVRLPSARVLLLGCKLCTPKEWLGGRNIAKELQVLMSLQGSYTHIYYLAFVYFSGSKEHHCFTRPFLIYVFVFEKPLLCICNNKCYRVELARL